MKYVENVLQILISIDLSPASVAWATHGALAEGQVIFENTDYKFVRVR